MGQTVRIDINSEGDFTGAFLNPTLGSSDGMWSFENRSTTNSNATGPGTNNRSSFAHTETSGSTSESSSENNGIAQFASVPDQITRTLKLRLCIQGRFGDGDEGLRIQHRAGDGAAWVTIVTIAGWSYGNDYGTGDQITDENSVNQVCAEDGGWVDYSIVIPDSASQVRIFPNYASANHQHDIALRSLQWSWPEPVLSDVTIQANGKSVSEGTPATFTINAEIAVTRDLPVNIKVTETGDTIGEATPESVTILSGSASAILTINTDDDTVNEPNSIITVIIQENRRYNIGTPASAKLTVIDDDVDPFDNQKPKPVIVEMTLKNSDGANVPVYLSASFSDFDLNGNTYRQLMTPDALSPISIGIQSVGGLSQESTTAIALINALADGPLYDPDTHTYIGQPVKISRVLPGNKIHELYRGLIRRPFITPAKFSLDISPQMVQRLRTLPYNDFFALKDFPFLPKQLVGLPIPMLFGDWDSLDLDQGIDTTEHFAAKVTITDFQNNKGIVARNITPDGSTTLFFIPRDTLEINNLNRTQDGDIFSFVIPVSITTVSSVIGYLNVDNDINKAGTYTRSRRYSRRRKPSRPCKRCPESPKQFCQHSP